MAWGPCDPLLSLALWLASAAQALSLSCAYPNMAETFNRVAAADEVFLLVHGRLIPPDRLPREIAGQSMTAVYTFDGTQIGATRDATLRRPVQVETTCLSVWCGALPGKPVSILGYMERDGGGLSLTLGPCPGEYLEAPKRQDIDVLRACLTRGRCGDAEIGHFQRDLD